jgi:hypothetical protein
MWRGYGGNGSGAALVIDTNELAPNETSPFIVSTVTYASHEARLRWINEKLSTLAEALRSEHVLDDELHVAAYQLLERLKIFALFTKHHGFREECEWRIVYLSQRDPDKKLASMLDYAVGSRGLEPKLKLKVRSLDGILAEDLSFDKVVSQIILGPSVSNPIAIRSVHRMLERIGKGSLIGRVTSSTTPYRS